MTLTPRERSHLRIILQSQLARVRDSEARDFLEDCRSILSKIDAPERAGAVLSPAYTAWLKNNRHAKVPESLNMKIPKG